MRINSLIPCECAMAQSDKGVYVSGAVGNILFVDGPPIRTQRFSLDSDNPTWTELDPREVPFHIRRFLRHLKDGQKVQSVEDVFKLPPNEAPCRSAPLRNHKSLKRIAEKIVGMGLLQVFSQVPMAAKPYLLIWLDQAVHGFHELRSSNMALAVIIAHFPEEGLRTMEPDDLAIACREVVQMPRREILNISGFPSKAITGFSKTTPAGCIPDCFRSLMKTLRNPDALKRFNHQTVLGPDAVSIFSRLEFLDRVSGSFLEELAEIDRVQLYPKYAPVLKYANDYRDLNSSSACPRLFRSPDQLDEWYFTTFDRMSLERLEWLLRCVFPAVPIQGVKGIISPILSGKALWRESVEMNNCAYEYAESMLRGECSLWSGGGKGTGLERCTVEIQPVPHSERDLSGHAYAIVQCSGRNNSALSYYSQEAIRTWAKSENLQICTFMPDEPPMQPNLPGL